MVLKRRSIPAECLDLIKQFEGFESAPYLCPAGEPTIGYGSTSYADGTRVTMKDDPISEAKASMMLERFVVHIWTFVDERIMHELDDNQMAALCSFVYNVGPGAFATSTLLRVINENPLSPKIKTELARWNKAGGKVNRGLVNRRKAESQLYFKPAVLRAV